jgi:hypothetical protein
MSENINEKDLELFGGFRSSNFEPKDEHLKCAPSKNFEDGSCFTLQSLRKIANAYNEKYQNNKINNIDSLTKRELVSNLTSRIRNCKDQTCWLDQDFTRSIRDDDIRHNTFRPLGPQGRFKWLNTTNINQIMGQYEHKYKDFRFLGAVPIDFKDIPVGVWDFKLEEAYEKGIYKIGVVFNLDEHWKSGSHWVAMFADIQKNQIYYYDSYGTPPEYRIREYMEKITKWCYFKVKKNMVADKDELKIKHGGNKKAKDLIDLRYNKMRHQYKNSECGVYSVNFILRLLKGETFDQINGSSLPDDTVNNCRKVYFRFNKKKI